MQLLAEKHERYKTTRMETLRRYLLGTINPDPLLSDYLRKANDGHSHDQDNHCAGPSRHCDTRQVPRSTRPHDPISACVHLYSFRTCHCKLLLLKLKKTNLILKYSFIYLISEHLIEEDTNVPLKKLKQSLHDMRQCVLLCYCLSYTMLQLPGPWAPVQGPGCGEIRRDTDTDNTGTGPANIATSQSAASDSFQHR